MLDTRSSLGWPASADTADPETSPTMVHTSMVPGSVHLWVFDVAMLERSAAENCRDVLSPDEIERAGRFHSPEDRNRFKSGRSIVRGILSHYVGQPPSGIRFRLGRHGKPFLEGSSLLVNWSHSGSLWSLAIAESGAIGVDIEVEANAGDWAGPASIAFSTNEIAYVIHAQDAERRSRHFLDVWTRKEALFKASGKGLHDEMRAISVIDAGGKPAAKLDLGAEGWWWLTEFRAAASMAGALATAFEPIDIQLFDGRALIDPTGNQGWASRRNCLSSVRLEPLP